MFGATYALASIGCALPVFLSFVAVALSDRDPFELAGALVAFALGATTMVTALVLVGAATSYAGRTLPGAAVSRFASGALLTASGAYVSYLQLGVLIGYPLGVPVVSLPF